MDGSADEARPRRRFFLEDPPPLSRIERTSFLSIIAVSLVVGIAVFATDDFDRPLVGVFELVLAALFAVFLWSPTAAVGLFSAAMAASFALETAPGTLLAFALTTGATTRTARAPLVFAQVALLLIATASVAHFPPSGSVDVGGYLLVAVVAGAVGFVIRAVSERGRHLSRALAEHHARERMAIVAVRQRIAAELHDHIAHDLVVITMHSKLLGAEFPEDVRAQSRSIIDQAARQALADVRRVIDLEDDPGPEPTPDYANLHATIERARGELDPTGRPLLVEGDVFDGRIPLATAAALARIVRESVTNILKYAAQGPVSLSLAHAADRVTLRISNPVPADRPDRTADHLRRGTGIVRMTEWVSVLGGELLARREGTDWVVTVQLPTA